MPLPLYQGLHAPSRPEHSQVNMGLWFERYFDGYAPDFCEVDKDSRSSWLRDLKTSKLGSPNDLQAKKDRLQSMVQAQGGQTRVFHCAGNFVTGLGNPHPIENGFLWHPTLGMPYLPGSAVKGLVRALVETAYQGGDKALVLKRWFGTAEKGDVAEASGCFIFFDALPTQPCELLPEIMTPHMGKWYEKGGEAPLKADTQPGDWHSPVPVGYLVARNLKLQFAIAPRAGAIPADQLATEIANVWKALEHALDWLGAGAKTAIGFGQFKEDSADRLKRAEDEKRSADQARTANMSEAQKIVDTYIREMREELEKYPNRKKDNPNGERHQKARTLAKTATDSSDWSAEDKHAAALAIEEWLPKLVAIDLKDERKKLKLGALKSL